MYKMNYDRAVLALWDEKLKEELHEAYYAFIPEMRNFISNPKIILQRPPKKRSPMLFEILSKWILELEEPNPVELTVFLLRHHELLNDRINRILDKDEILVQVKRRRLLG
ncbi:hypothetical protein LCGC14_2576270 [marine sediment metagenome]|uniref:Uncharacterized protein n=1 Tax=marine sediment metagenome TaxID=412755 RepID=A0A0F9CRZ2_9ZZZZ